MSTALVQSRIDTEIKRIAEEDFKKMGLDATTAIRMFYAHVARTHSVPVSLETSPHIANRRAKKIKWKSEPLTPKIGKKGEWIIPRDEFNDEEWDAWVL
jgi:addiction module RelB/DinJ family antitoxin